MCVSYGGGMRIKKRKKSYIKHSKNGTWYYGEVTGDKWIHCEPFKILYFKYNQYLINRDGSYLKISQMNQKGYEYSVYLYNDLKENIDVEYLDREIKEAHSYLIERK